MEPCACEEARQKCTNEYCVLAPYLPANNPEVYACLSQVFEISVVVKNLKDLEPSQRQKCVDSYYFEAKYRLLDPVLGYDGLVRHLQRQIEDLKLGLEMDKRGAQGFARGPLSQSYGTTTTPSTSD
ncbi:unnamed protein product [Arabis nemorensis]|uniref:LOB domain-containing protein n=1 Tax=Arabis nemorensis TaxID=586526 RepID=A0A565BV04_9BRAS|nr:unnamed protein product [Arabis nemorensis]